ncbi:MAG: hypothetical protein ACUVXH_07245 [Anaerolineae bacterium]
MAHSHAHPTESDLAKLRVLLPHWAEHNQEHAAGFREWAVRAREHGQVDAAEALEQAAQQMEAANAALERALRALEKGHAHGG